MLIAILVVSVLGTATAAGSWKYGETRHGVYGPKDWGHVSTYCDGSSQSPVNINRRNVRNGDHLGNLKVNFDNRKGRVKGTLVNNGHAPELKVDKSRGGASLINPFDGEKYILEQVHFHFGCSDYVGSEHTVDNVPYSGEVHLVTFNAKYGDFGTAATKSDGLTVIGVFLQKRKYHGNKEIRKLTKQLKRITAEDFCDFLPFSLLGTEKRRVTVRLGNLVPGLSSGRRSYYTYKGSLTTPGCNESVRWFVLRSPIRVNESMLKDFRALETTHGYSGGKMCNNNRPTLPLNGRQVYLFESPRDVC